MHVFTRSQKRSRAALTEAVTQLPREDHIAIEEAARQKKRKRNGVAEQRTHREISGDEGRSSERHEGEFFDTVTDEVKSQRIAKFIDATGNDALTTGICAVCAGRFFRQGMTDMLLSTLQTDKTLEPMAPHPAHDLIDGMLLYRSEESVSRNVDGELIARMCRPCESSLQKKKTPALSLANGMWIGEVPLVLKILTLPERILVARYFLAAYIVKLYPKKKGARTWAEGNALHSGLQGNVSTYRLNTVDIATLMGQRTMPPPCRILAATVGVTFVGPQNLPEKTLPGFLRVNRNRVRDALEWLKANNPIYADIVICADRLGELPTDGVPFEISSQARHLVDETLLADERDGYIPEDDEDENGTPGEKKGTVKRDTEILTFLLRSDRMAACAGVMDIDEEESGNGDDMTEEGK